MYSPWWYEQVFTTPPLIVSLGTNIRDKHFLSINQGFE